LQIGQVCVAYVHLAALHRNKLLSTVGDDHLSAHFDMSFTRWSIPSYISTTSYSENFCYDGLANC